MTTERGRTRDNSVRNPRRACTANYDDRADLFRTEKRLINIRDIDRKRLF